MTSDRIKEIQLSTAYPDSVSVKQALLQVWNECEQSTSDLTTEVTRLREALEVETKTTKRLTRGINLCLAVINGGLDGLELDNTCDVTENSFIIQQLEDQSEILIKTLTHST